MSRTAEQNEEEMRLEKEHRETQYRRRFRFGEKFIVAFGEVMLVNVFGDIPRFVRIKDGRDKAGFAKFDIPIEYDDLGEFITTLPTLYSSDFGYDESYNGQVHVGV